LWLVRVCDPARVDADARGAYRVNGRIVIGRISMTERQFIQQRARAWDAWDAWCGGAAAQAPEAGASPAGDARIADEDVPSAYRALCLDLSIARDRGYSEPLQDALHHRVFLAHQRIYGAAPRARLAWLAWAGDAFPALVRREWRVVAVAAALLFVPLLAQLLVVIQVPSAVYLVLPPERVGEAEAMYAPGAAHLGRPRGASTDWMMWGFYVANNVRIDFQCFAGGIAFGLGTVFFLLYNGLVIGTIAGHLTRLGYVETFWGFVAGHSSFELLGATLAGAAGLILGGALIAPGRSTRGAALVARGRVAVQLLAGAGLMTFLAAFVEAFWSPRQDVPAEGKYAVGAALWILLAAYLLLAGRTRRAQ